MGKDTDATYEIKFDTNLPADVYLSEEVPPIPSIAPESGTIWEEVNGDYVDNRNKEIILPDELDNEFGDPQHHYLYGWKFKGVEDDNEENIFGTGATILVGDLLYDATVETKGETSNPTTNYLAELEAVWMPDYYSFDFYDGYPDDEVEIEGVPDRIEEISYDSTDTLAFPELTDPTGEYEFEGWRIKSTNYILEALEEYSIQDIVQIIDDEEVLGGDGVYDLEGVWAKQYTVTYHANDYQDDATGNTDSQYFYDDETVTIADCGFAREGYTFIRWETSPADTKEPVPYNPGYLFPDYKNQEMAADLDLYAQWESKTYDVEFGIGDLPEDEASDGLLAALTTHNTTQKNILYHLSDENGFLYDNEEPNDPIYGTATIPDYSDDQKHYVFDGEWHVTKTREALGEEVIVVGYYDPGADVSIRELVYQYGDESPIKMCPVWEAKEYSFTFDGNYIEEIEPNQPYDKEGTVTIPSLDDQDGQVFVGWAFIDPDEEITADDERIIPGDAEMSIKELVLKLDEANEEWLADENNGTNAAVGREYQIPWRNNDNYQNSFNLTGIFKDVYTVTYHDTDPEPILGDVSEIYDTNRSTPVEIKSAEELEFIKEGVELVRWETRADGTAEPWYEESYQPGDSVPLEGNLDLYAVWAYTVTYDLNGHGSFPEGFTNPQKVSEGGLAPEPDIAASEIGWTLTGWTCNNEPWLFNEDNKVHGNITLVAQWSPKTFTIEFVGNAPYEDSINPASQDRAYDGNISIPTMANGDGWKLIGWAYNENPDGVDIMLAEDGTWPVKKIVDNGTVEPASNNGDVETFDTVKLYGVWGNTADVIMYFNYNGGEGDLISKTNPEGSKDILPIEGEYNIKKTGYYLKGWDKNSEATEPTYKPGAEIALFEGTIYAIWTPMPYVIKYNYNAPDDMIGELENEINTVEGLYSEGTTVEIDDFLNSYVDYKLVGWSLCSELLTIYNSDTTVDALVDEAFANSDLDLFDPPFEGADFENCLELYGVWEKQKYNVTLVIGEEHGQLKEEEAKQSVYYGEKAKAPANEPVDQGYSFMGWYVDPEDDESRWSFDNPVEDNITLTAKWTPKHYIFKFDLNNEDGEIAVYNIDSETDTVASEPKAYNATITFDKLKDNNNVYKFLGWALDKDAGTADYLAGYEEDVADIVDEAEVIDGTITLYAVWTTKTFAIWQDDDGEILQMSEIDPETGEYDPYEGTPEKDNYDFVEWDEPVEDENGNLVFKAKFTPKKYKISFVDEDGTLLLEKEYEYGTKADDIDEPTPTKVGYDFVEWDSEISDVTKDTTYKAKYTIRKFGVKFVDFDGRELTADVQYAYGTKAADIVKPADPTRAGYTFTGWTPAIADVTGNATYTATYVQNASGGNDNPVVKYWTITWKNYDGKGSETTAQVKEGDVPSYNGTPSKAEDNAYTYTFKGWTPAVVAATADATYTAEFTGSAKQNNNNNNVTTPSPTPTPEPTPEPTPTPTPSAPAVYDIEYYEEFPDGTAVLLKKTNNPDKYTYGVGAEIKYGIDKEGYKFNGWYSKRSKKYVTKIGTTTKGTVKLYARFVPVDDGNGEGGDNGSGTPASDFGTLFVCLTEYTEDSMKLVWQLMDGVDGYDIFGSRCNSADVIRPYEPIASVEGDINEYVMENLLAKTYYKFYVRAYILVNGEKRYITTSINVHGVTLNDKYGVADDINIEKAVVKYTNGKSKTKYNRANDGDVEEINITMKVGQTLKIVASEYNADGKEIRAHRPISFESSKPDILKVGKKKNHKYGVEVKDKANTYKSHTITAKAEGECTIYVFAQNGIYTKVNVTVKAAK